MNKFLQAAGLLLFLCIPAQAQYRSAQARAITVNGFVVEVQITDPGSGYSQPPNVEFSGGGGSGANAYSLISSDGQVTNIVVTSAGRDYKTPPEVTITEPKFIGLLGILSLPTLIITNATGTTVQISFADKVDASTWTTLTNIYVTANPFLFVDFDAVQKQKRFYKVKPAEGNTGGLAPLTLNNHSLHVGLSGGPFAPAIYDIILTGGNTGTFQLTNGSDGSGNYSYAFNGSNPILTLNYTDPSGGDQDVYRLVFTTPNGGSFTGSQKVSGPGGTLTSYDNLAGTFTNFAPR